MALIGPLSSPRLPFSTSLRLPALANLLPSSLLGRAMGLAKMVWHPSRSVGKAGAYGQLGRKVVNQAVRIFHVASWEVWLVLDDLTATL
jgi:hypothetical protein